MKTGFKLFFVESICDDPKIIETNILEVKVTSPDYKHFDKETILHDFLERINHYEKLYGQAHDIFSPIFQIRIYKYFLPNIMQYCLDFFKYSKLRKQMPF